MRLDLHVAQNFQLSRSTAADYIKRNLISVNGTLVTKPSLQVNDNDLIEIHITTRFVSRGGEKLAALIPQLPFSIHSFQCLDIGSSTGGFTQCLLQNQVKHVVCVDIGYNQLHPSLREHPAITLYEETSIFDLHRFVQHTFDLIVMDVSFTTVVPIISTLAQFTHPQSYLIILFKPQFEVGPKFLTKSGVVKNIQAAKLAQAKCVQQFNDHGYHLLCNVDAMVKGKEGNQETFLVFQRVEEK